MITKLLILVFFIFQINVFSQIVGLGYQTTFQSNQFVASYNEPFRYSDWRRDFAIKYGVDFTTRNTNSFSGLNLKPLQFCYNFGTSNNHYNKPLIAVSQEFGFLINNGIGNNGVITSTNFYIDSGTLVYFKSGYEYHLQDKVSQFYARIGFTISQNLNLRSCQIIN